MATQIGNIKSTESKNSFNIIATIPKIFSIFTNLTEVHLKVNRDWIFMQNFTQIAA